MRIGKIILHISVENLWIRLVPPHDRVEIILPVVLILVRGFPVQRVTHVVERHTAAQVVIVHHASMRPARWLRLPGEIHNTGAAVLVAPRRRDAVRGIGPGGRFGPLAYATPEKERVCRRARTTEPGHI